MRLEPYAICRTCAWQISPNHPSGCCVESHCPGNSPCAAARRSAKHALQQQAEDARKIALS
jgi:hypothetical protein